MNTSPHKSDYDCFRRDLRKEALRKMSRRELGGWLEHLKALQDHDGSCMMHPSNNNEPPTHD